MTLSYDIEPSNANIHMKAKPVTLTFEHCLGVKCINGTCIIAQFVWDS